MIKSMGNISGAIALAVVVLTARPALAQRAFSSTSLQPASDAGDADESSEYRGLYRTVQLERDDSPGEDFSSLFSETESPAVVADEVEVDTIILDDSNQDLSGFGGCDCQTECGCESSCDACCDCDPCGSPWRLQEGLEPCGNCSGITFGGWLQAGIRWNDQGNNSGVGNHPAGGFTNDAGSLNLHQAWAFVGKQTDTGGCGFDWGFRADVLYGADGPDTQAFGDIGWDADWGGNANAGGNQYGAAMPQAYLELAYNDITLKAGHFFTIMGYETVAAPQNYFYTHAYTMYYGEPFTHTGALVDFAVSDQWTIAAGWTQGWDRHSAIGLRSELARKSVGS